jgi:hypothetical protein
MLRHDCRKKGKIKMKKHLTITLALILVVALAMGACNNNGSSSDEDDQSLEIVVGGDGGADAEEELFWPADIFPADFPEYPDGTVTYIDDSDKFKTVLIKDSKKQAYDAFKASLEGAGWAFSETAEGEDELAYKGFFMLMLSFSEGSASVMLMETETEFDGFSEVEPHTPVDLPTYIEGWPKDLPYSLPVYPDGDIEYKEPDLEEDSPAFRITVRNTSKISFDKFAAAFEADGWEIKSKTETGYSFIKDGQHVSFVFVGTIVNIFAFVRD